jgi:carbamoyl-phosphate synthase large subunit
MKNILFSSVGKRVELVNIFKKEIESLSLDIKIIGTDADPDWSPACYVCDKFESVPYISNGGFIQTILDICDRENIGVIIPTIDTELLLYAENRSLFSERGIEIILSDERTIRIFRDKLKAFELFEAKNIPTPKTYLLTPELIENIDLNGSYIAKPSAGSCSVGLMLNPTKDDLFKAIDGGEPYILQEKLFGKEYTVNCFISNEGKLVAAIPHYRYKVRAGEVSFGITERLAVLDDFAKQIVEMNCGLAGPFCFQAIVDSSGSSGVIELNPRFGGGYPLANQAGGRMARWILEQSFSLDKSYESEWISGLRMMRYDAAIFSGAV